MARTDIRAVPDPSLEPPALPPEGFEWHKALDVDELPGGRVKTVSIGRRSLALTHHAGGYGALDNRRPHQGGPLGEGSIEKGWLRCPWHSCPWQLPVARVRLLPLQREAAPGVHRRAGRNTARRPTCPLTCRFRAPPGTRTLNPRIKRPKSLVQPVSSKPVTCGFVRRIVRLMPL